MSKKENHYKGIGYEKGSIYLSAREKEFIIEMIDVYYMSPPINDDVDIEEEKLINMIKEKVEKVKSI